MASAFPELFAVLQQRIAKVLAGGSASTFEVNLAADKEPGAYRVRLQLQESPKGVLLFFRPVVGG